MKNDSEAERPSKGRMQGLSRKSISVLTLRPAMAFPMRSNPLLYPVSILPGAGLAASGTATISAEAMTEASKHCTTRSIGCRRAVQASASACSSPAVEQIIMGVPANRAELFALDQYLHAGKRRQLQRWERF